MIVWHKHHIVPRHAGGTDDPSNLLKCNVPMHIFMHEQRYRETGDEYDRVAALALKGSFSKTEANKAAIREYWNRNPVDTRNKKTLKCVVTSPSGCELEIDNVDKFCKDYGFNSRSFHNILGGRAKSTRDGWTIRRKENDIALEK